MEPVPQTKSMSAGWIAFLVIVLLSAVIVIVGVTVFQVRYVSVTGNYHVSADKVLSLAGLQNGGFFFAVNEDKVRKGVESNLYLVLESLEKNPPDSVTIHVRERTEAAYLSYQNANYLLDTQGFVLNRSGADAVPVPLQLRGMTVRSIQVGSTVVSGSSQQLIAFQTIAEELRIQNMLDLFSEINVTDVKNIYLVTVDNRVATLGTCEDIRAKLLTLGGVMQYVSSYGLQPGSLDVSQPGYCTYTPNY